MKCMYATGHGIRILFPGCLNLKTTLSMNDDASAGQLVISSVGLNVYNVSPEIIAVLTFWKAISWLASHHQ